MTTLFSAGRARALLACAAVLAVLGATALLRIDHPNTIDVATNTNTARVRTPAPALADDAVDGTSTTAVPGPTSHSTTTKPRLRTVVTDILDEVPKILDLPKGWVAFEEAQRLVAVRADGSRRVAVSREGEKVLGASWSPLTNQIAYLVENSPKMRVVNVDTGAAREFDLGASAYNYMFAAPTWSPTGLHIAVNTTDGLVLVKLVGGETESLGAALDGDMAFSPTGTRIAGRAPGCYVSACKNTNLIVVPVGGGDRQTISVTSGFQPRSPMWSLDGTRLAFLVGIEPSEATTVVIGVNGQGEHVVASSETAGAGRAMTPMAWDPLIPNAMFLLGDPTGVRYAVVGANSLKTIGPEAPSMPAALSPNGLQLAYGQSCDNVYGGCLYTVDRSGNNERLIAKLAYTGTSYWTAGSSAVALREPFSKDWTQVVVHSVVSDKWWVLSERMPANVLTPDAYLYPSRALL